MAILIVKDVTRAADGFWWGVRSPEVGINVRRMQIRYYPEVNERYKNAAGETFLRSVSAYFSREISCEGEITGTNGIMAFTLGLACNFSNPDINFFFNIGGTFFLDEAVVSEERRGWRSVSVRASSSPLL